MGGGTGDVAGDVTHWLDCNCVLILCVQTCAAIARMPRALRILDETTLLVRAQLSVRRLNEYREKSIVEAAHSEVKRHPIRLLDLRGRIVPQFHCIPDLKLKGQKPFSDGIASPSERASWKAAVPAREQHLSSGQPAWVLRGYIDAATPQQVGTATAVLRSMLRRPSLSGLQGRICTRPRYYKAPMPGKN